MKIQIVKFESGRYGARVKGGLFSTDKYLSVTPDCEFTRDVDVIKYCTFRTKEAATEEAYNYVERYRLKRKKLTVEVIEEIEF